MDNFFISIQSYELIIITTILNLLFLLSFITQILQKQELLKKIGTICTCSICRKRISQKDYLVICPFCASNFHRNHLRKWLIIKNVCPVCRNSFHWYNVNYDNSSSHRITTSLRSSVPQTTTSYSRRNYRLQDHQPRNHNNQGGIRNFSIECTKCGDIWYKLTSYIPEQCRKCGLPFRNANERNYILRKCYSNVWVSYYEENHFGSSPTQRLKKWISHLLTWIKQKTPPITEFLNSSNQSSHYTCSRCNNVIFEDYQFCNNCGEIVRR